MGRNIISHTHCFSDYSNDVNSNKCILYTLVIMFSSVTFIRSDFWNFDIFHQESCEEIMIKFKNLFRFMSNDKKCKETRLFVDNKVVVIKQYPDREVTKTYKLTHTVTKYNEKSST